MNKATIGKYAMMGLGLALTLGASIVNGINQDKKMEETVVKKVAEALADKAKES